jgi:hypothetical protein
MRRCSGACCCPSARRAIVNHLHQELSAILRLGRARALDERRRDVVGSPPKEFADYMEREIEKWTKVVKTANTRAD